MERDVCTPGVCAAIHSSASGSKAGGDIYYFSVCNYESLTRLAIADVRGHGEEVSELSGWLYQALERHMNDANGASILTELNRITHKRGFDALTTAAIATFHREKQTLTFAYAGHSPMLLWRAGKGWSTLETPTLSGPSNLPLGVMRETSFAQGHARVQPGDRLFVCTDGVGECPDAGGEFYGDYRLLDVLERNAQLPVSGIRDFVRDDLIRYAGGAVQHDDCTFLTLEVLTPPPSLLNRARTALASLLRS